VGRISEDQAGRLRWPLLLPSPFLAAALRRNSMKNGSLAIPTRQPSQPGGIDSPEHHSAAAWPIFP
jgi:hypothetical protein